MTCRPGTLSINKRSAGWPLADFRLSSMICASCCVGSKAARVIPAPRLPGMPLWLLETISNKMQARRSLCRVENASDGNTMGSAQINGEQVDPLIGWCLTYFINFTGYPAASIPPGLAEGKLPVGMQIIGRRYADGDVLAASATLCQGQVSKASRPLLAIQVRRHRDLSDQYFRRAHPEIPTRRLVSIEHLATMRRRALPTVFPFLVHGTTQEALQRREV
jgi:hypothetical protein